MQKKSAAIKIVSTKSGSQTSVLSKGQKLFNQLIKKIELQRDELKAWQELLPLCMQKYASEFTPLIKNFSEYRKEMIYLLDKSYSNPSLNKTEKLKLSTLICDVCSELIPEYGEELKEIYNRYSKRDFDAKIKAERQSFKAFMEQMLDINLDDADVDDLQFSSIEESMQKLGPKILERLAKQEDEQENKTAKRKKSEKQLAKEAKQKAEIERVNQSLREIYRKLASALHPDRETDPVERERKTLLMQRVNSAYENQNLLELLELQLEIEQIDQASVSALSDDRLKHYNKILKDQVAELEEEVLATQEAFKMRFSAHPLISVSSRNALRILDIMIKEVESDIRCIQTDLDDFQSIKKLKAWLKDYSIEPDFEESSGLVFMSGARV